jgi:hypothetical protein
MVVFSFFGGFGPLESSGALFYRTRRVSYADFFFSLYYSVKVSKDKARGGG